MARPRNADPEQTRRRVLGAAAEAFTAAGRDGASMRQIARGADVSIATIHYYFGSKERLFDAVMADAWQTVGGTMPMARVLLDLREAVRALTPDQVRQAVDDLVRSTFRQLRAERGALQLIMQSVLIEGALDASWREVAIDPFLDEMSELLTQPSGLVSAELRLRLQSLVALTSRYALSSDLELAMTTGAATGAEGLSRTEEHLVSVAHLLLGV